MLDRLEVKEWLELNAKLQHKKNILRRTLKERGVLKKEGENTFDRYKYFSEAQYKMLFTELFAMTGLELKFTELEYQLFDGTDKQANGRMPRLEFSLIDCETGFYETTVITGEGIDKGDKAGYKAYTGALKYYLADTFLVATGDDPEKESPENKVETKAEAKPTTEKKASPKQVELINKMFADKMGQLLAYYKVDKVEDLPMKVASGLIAQAQKGTEQ